TPRGRAGGLPVRRGPQRRRWGPPVQRPRHRGPRLPSTPKARRGARGEKWPRSPGSGRFLLQLLVLGGGVEDDRLALLEDDFLGDDDFARRLHRWDVVHDIEHGGFENG